MTDAYYEPPIPVAYELKRCWCCGHVTDVQVEQRSCDDCLEAMQDEESERKYDEAKNEGRLR